MGSEDILALFLSSLMHSFSIVRIYGLLMAI
jgi:hypothetical protein